MHKIKRLIIFLLVFISCIKGFTQDFNNPVNIVYNKGIAPIKFTDEDGNPSGILNDYWKLLDKKTDLNFNFIEVDTFGESLEMVRDGRADIHAGIFYTEERSQFLDYSEPILNLKYYIYSSPDLLPPSQLKDVKGLILGTVQGGYTENQIKKEISINRLIVYEDFKSMFEAALDGDIKVFVSSDIHLNYYLSVNNRENPFRHREKPLYEQTYYGATAKGNDTLINKIKLSQDLITDKNINSLKDKWLNFKVDDIPAQILELLTDEELQWLFENPVLSVHNEQDWPPFNYFENNQPLGFSIDYMNLLAELLEVKIEYNSGPSWNSFLEMIKKKELDVMLNIVKTNDRQNYILFTDTYIMNPNVIVSSKANSFKTVEELYGKTVAIPKGFFYEEVLRDNYPLIKHLPLEDLLACLKAVSFGDADAVLGEEAVVRTLIARNMLSELEISGEAAIGNPDYENLRIGVRDDYPLLQSALTKAMAAVTPQQMQELQQKWLSKIPLQKMNDESEIQKEKSWFSGSQIFIYILTAFIILSLSSWLVIRTTKKRDIAINFGSKQFRLLTIAGLSIIISIIVVLGLLLLDRNRIETINTTEESLIITLENAEVRLNLWIKQSTSYLERLGRDPELSNLVSSLLTVNPDKETLISSPELKDVREFFTDQQDEFPNIGFFVIDPDNISVGSRRDTNIGTPNLIERHILILLKGHIGERLCLFLLWNRMSHFRK